MPVIGKSAEVMEAGERWLQEGALYRRENRQRVREMEGLPEHDGERYVVKVGEETKRVGLAIGRRKGKGAGKPLAEGFWEAALDTDFDLLVNDPADLARELSDLGRDWANFLLAEGVRHLGHDAVGTALPDEVLRNDEKLDEWMQQELLRKRAL